MKRAIAVILLLAVPAYAQAPLPGSPPPAPSVIAPPPPVAPAPVPPAVQLSPPSSQGYGVPSNINRGPVLSGGGGSVNYIYRLKRPAKRQRLRRHRPPRTS